MPKQHFSNPPTTTTPQHHSTTFCVSLEIHHSTQLTPTPQMPSLSFAASSAPHGALLLLHLGHLLGAGVDNSQVLSPDPIPTRLTFQTADAWLKS